jgi:hypothetical protein
MWACRRVSGRVINPRARASESPRTLSYSRGHYLHPPAGPAVEAPLSRGAPPAHGDESLGRGDSEDLKFYFYKLGDEEA